MEERKMLISREELAKRWDIKSTQTIINYENDGIITRVPEIPTPRYRLVEIQKLEGLEFNPLSPYERKRLEKEVAELSEKVRVQAQQLMKISALGLESMNILSNLN